MNRKELAKNIYAISHLTGEFLLRSGKTSNEYFDKYRFEAQPIVLESIASHLAELIPAETEVIAGLEMGGIPIVTALSLKTGIPAAFVRKKAKEYGTCRVAEGTDLRDKKVLIIEDVITSGGQVVLSAADIRNDGGNIIGCLCVIDRQQGGADALLQAGITLSPLFTMSELKQVAAEE
ncbi:MAG TPA: orotate phosphoribosyltransferase [Candidatus Kapabacteria bacterium]|jgi:orotate phosphoribosyltransferase|nr:orotate phosphoribosyltransferase [Ignavibacteria bacterium]HRE56319.1 orotate phosphoribosyltransferase [Candidatus Kapabacteria bacterium]HRI31724.1 orotate phosphoribosyltransferase [Candidatus Kapabacteria bacterium]